MEGWLENQFIAECFIDPLITKVKKGAAICLSNDLGGSRNYEDKHIAVH